MREPNPGKPDPLLKAVGQATPPPTREVVTNQDSSGDSASGTPEAGRTTLKEARRKGVLGLLQILGPGLITGASDDDPSGIGTYSQVGAQFGFGMLWTAIFTFPLMAAVQELCARIALQTGVGLGVVLRRKYPNTLVGFCILLLLVANTINIGADLGAVAAGGELLTRGFIKELWLVVPAAGLILGLQFFVTYARIFSIFKWLTVALFAYVIPGLVVHPPVAEVVRATVIPHIEFSTAFLTALVAVLGTTISPYLFFWQASSEVDEMRAAGLRTEAQRRGVRQQELNAARTDVLLGMFFSNVVMYFIILTTAATLNAHHKTDISSAQQAATSLEPFAGHYAFILFAVGLIGTGLLAIPILSGSAAYALKEFLGLPGTLAEKPRHRPTFYAILLLATIVGVAINFVHIDPVKALFWSAVINGVVAPPLLVLIMVLGADRSVMKERTSGWLSRTLGWAATILMSIAAVAVIVLQLAVPLLHIKM